MFDLVARTVLQARAATSYTDTPSGTLTLTGTIVEARVAANTASGTLTLTGTIVDAKVYTDAKSGTLTLSGPNTEANTQAVAVSGTLTLSGSSGAAGTDTDTQTGTLTLTGTTGEVHLYTTTTSGAETLSGTITESVVYTDAPSGTITITGTIVEANADSDTLIGILLLSGTLDEAYTAPITYTDTPAGTLTTSGTASDAATYTDTPVGVIGGQVGPPQIVYVPVGTPGKPPPPMIHRVHDETIIILREYSDAPSGVLHLSGTLSETITAPLPDVIRHAFEEPIIATERVTSTVEVPVEVERLIPVTTRADSQYGLITFTGTLTETYTAPPSVEDELDQLINTDPTILFEVFNHA